MLTHENEKLINEERSNILSIKAFEVETSLYMSASLHRNDRLNIILNGKKLLSIENYQWEQVSNNILSHTQSEWGVSLPYRFDTITKLQVFVSLIHLASVISNTITIVNSPSDPVQQGYFDYEYIGAVGRVFVDKLPARNRLIVYPDTIQEKLRNAPPNVVDEIMQSGRIYKCTIERDISEKEFIFYYKPYNVPVGIDPPSGDPARDIFDEIQEAHRALLRR